MNRTKPTLSRPTKVAIVAVIAVMAAVFVCAMPLSGRSAIRVGAPAAAASRFCALTEEAVPGLPADAATMDAAAMKLVKRTAKDLAEAGDKAPEAIRKDVRKLATTLAALASAEGVEGRGTVIAKHAAGYSAAVAALAAYRAQNCIAAPPPAPSLPVVGAAAQMACLSDARTLRAAEDLYATVNGRFATLPELVTARLLRSTSVYYTEIRVGTPAGGYTLLAAPSGQCGNVPVAG